MVLAVLAVVIADWGVVVVEDGGTLATFPYGNIQRCSSGGYYVKFGYVTLRLSYEELKSYREMLSNVIESEEFKKTPEDIVDKLINKLNRKWGFPEPKKVEMAKALK